MKSIPNYHLVYIGPERPGGFPRVKISQKPWEDKYYTEAEIQNLLQSDIPEEREYVLEVALGMFDRETEEEPEELDDLEMAEEEE